MCHIFKDNKDFILKLKGVKKARSALHHRILNHLKGK